MPLKGKCVGSEIHAACSIKINPWEKLAKGEKRLVAEGLISLCLVSSRVEILSEVHNYYYRGNISWKVCDVSEM